MDLDIRQHDLVHISLNLLPLSPTSLELQGPKLGLWTTLLLLYADDVVLFAYEPNSMHQLLQVLQVFCHESGLQVNIAKTKMMAECTIQPKHPLVISFGG